MTCFTTGPEFGFAATLGPGGYATAALAVPDETGAVGSTSFVHAVTSTTAARMKWIVRMVYSSGVMVGSRPNDDRPYSFRHLATAWKIADAPSVVTVIV